MRYRQQAFQRGGRWGPDVVLDRLESYLGVWTGAHDPWSHRLALVIQATGSEDVEETHARSRSANVAAWLRRTVAKRTHAHPDTLALLGAWIIREGWWSVTLDAYWRTEEAMFRFGAGLRPSDRALAASFIVRTAAGGRRLHRGDAARCQAVDRALRSIELFPRPGWSLGISAVLASRPEGPEFLAERSRRTVALIARRFPRRAGVYEAAHLGLMSGLRSREIVDRMYALHRAMPQLGLPELGALCSVSLSIGTLDIGLRHLVYRLAEFARGGENEAIRLATIACLLSVGGQYCELIADGLSYCRVMQRRRELDPFDLGWP